MSSTNTKGAIAMFTIPRQSGLVQAISVDKMNEIGLFMPGANQHGPCPLCGCRFGSHDAVIPAATTAATLLGTIGTIECPDCLHPAACGTWALKGPPSPIR